MCTCLQELADAKLLQACEHHGTVSAHSSHVFPCVRLQVAEAAAEMDGDTKKFSNYTYPAMTKTQGSFRLQVEAGEFTDSEIIVMLGENGTGTAVFGLP